VALKLAAFSLQNKKNVGGRKGKHRRKEVERKHKRKGTENL
jgi:hypothetical protein